MDQYIEINGDNNTVNNYGNSPSRSKPTSLYRGVGYFVDSRKNETYRKPWRMRVNIYILLPDGTKVKYETPAVYFATEEEAAYAYNLLVIKKAPMGVHKYDINIIGAPGTYAKWGIE